MKMMPFSANMQSIKDTKQNLAKAELGLSQLLQNTEIQIHTLVDKLNKSEASIKASQMNIKLAQKAYDMTVKAYNSGKLFKSGKTWIIKWKIKLHFCTFRFRKCNKCKTSNKINVGRKK